MDVLLAAIEEAEAAALPPAAVAILVMSVFIFLLLVTFGFRSVHTRHPEHTGGHGPHH
jgi:hypothetical protein